MTQHVHKPTAPFRLMMIMLMVLLVSLILLWRVIDLHVVRKTFLQDQGDARYLRVIPLAAHRGMITDRHGEPLAISTPVDSVWVQPREFAAAHADWTKLASLLELDMQELSRLIMQRRDKEFVYIKRHISPALAEQVMALNIPGVSLQREYHRYYPMGEVAAHVVGFTNIDDQGQEGLELAYDKWLRGEAGSQRVMKDRLGRIVKHVELIRKPRPGNQLALSIDRRLQYLTYRELKRAVFAHKAKSGSAVILDVQTGEILAMVNQPSYNPNNREKLQAARLRNRAVTDVFEPGSAIKPITIATALQSGKFTSRSVIDTAPGYYHIGNNTVRDVRNYGQIDLARIIEKSSNVGASKIALALQSESLWRSLSRFGFGSISGSGFPGEASGLLNPPSQWSRIEQATLSYGYGLSVTPVQLVRAYGAIAANGILRPVSFTRVTGQVDGEQIITPAVARALQHMLERVTGDAGTGKQARVAGYRVAGKTGTVKKATAGGYSDEQYLSVFAGMAPASQPRIAMVVVIHEPRQGTYYGGEVAAPVFSRVMAAALRLFDIAPDNVNQQNVQLAALAADAGGDHP